MRAVQEGAGRPLSLAAIVASLGGRVVGNDAVMISQVGSLQHATHDQIAFFSSPRHKIELSATRAAAVILAPESVDLTSLPRIVADNPYAYFARVSQLFNPPLRETAGVHPSAQIGSGVCIAATAHVGPGVVIGEGAVVGDHVSIGSGCQIGAATQIGNASLLYPGVVIYHDCRIGARAIIHSGAVLGADGFGIANDAGRWVKIPQIGRLLIGDDVEIGANTTIDRGAIDDTVIEDGVKLDNQIQIGHNCHVGAHTAMAGCVAVAGSARIGKHCTIGAGAIILGHLSIADHVNISAATVISRSIRHSGTYTGMFPFDENRSWARNAALVRHLADLADRVRALERCLHDKESKDG